MCVLFLNAYNITHPFSLATFYKIFVMISKIYAIGLEHYNCPKCSCDVQYLAC